MAEENKNLEAILGQVLETAQASSQVELSLENFRKDNTDAKAINNYVAYADVPLEQKVGFAQALVKKSPAVVAGYIADDKKKIDANLVELMKKNYEAIVTGIPEEYLGLMALEAAGIGEEMRNVQKAAQTNDFGTLRKVFAERYKNYSTWVKFVLKDADEQDLKILTKGYLESVHGSFMKDYVTMVGEGKEAHPVQNSEKLRAYLQDAAKDGDEKKQNRLYSSVAKGIYQIEAMKQAQAEAAKNPPKGAHKQGR